MCILFSNLYLHFCYPVGMIVFITVGLCVRKRKVLFYLCDVSGTCRGFVF